MSNHDEGSVTAFVTSMLVVFIASAGLAVDGGRLVASRIELLDHAENAARAAVQNVTNLRSGDPRVDVDRARTVAEGYLRSHGVSGVVLATPEVVTVSVTRQVPMTVLSVIGVASRSISVERSATPVPGP
ncbi:MAG: pilus assembly protein TadG-related protein [Ilumatobacteraceae bacterium]